jgi:hypothetical protein
MQRQIRFSREIAKQQRRRLTGWWWPSLAVIAAVVAGILWKDFTR